MNILICGASGFIGSNLAAHYVETEHKVTGTYHINAYDPNLKINWRCADLTDQASVDSVMEGVDVVIQCAAYSTGSKDAIERPWMFVVLSSCEEWIGGCSFFGSLGRTDTSLNANAAMPLVP